MESRRLFVCSEFLYIPVATVLIEYFQNHCCLYSSRALVNHRLDSTHLVLLQTLLWNLLLVVDYYLMVTFHSLSGIFNEI